MAGLLNLIPKYLPRYGMAPSWARAVRPLVLLLTAIAFLVTWIFKADVNAQGGAYATGVLVLFTSAGTAVTLAARRAGQRWLARAFAVITLVFVYTTVDNVIERPDGVKIGACFIGGILAVSVASRLNRSFELRTTDVRLDETAELFLRDCARRTIRLVANEPDARDREEYDDKLRQIRRDHDLPEDTDVIFVEVTVTDPSDFETGALEVHGHVLHGAYRVLTLESSSVPNALADPAADRAGPHRGHPAHLLRVDRGQPGREPRAVPAVRRRRGRAGHPGGAAPRGAAPPGPPRTCTSARTGAGAQ